MIHSLFLTIFFQICKRLFWKSSPFYQWGGSKAGKECSKLPNIESCFQSQCDSFWPLWYLIVDPVEPAESSTVVATKIVAEKAFPCLCVLVLAGWVSPSAS